MHHSFTADAKTKEFYIKTSTQISIDQAIPANYYRGRMLKCYPVLLHLTLQGIFRPRDFDVYAAAIQSQFRTQAQGDRSTKRKGHSKNAFRQEVLQSVRLLV